MKDHKGKLRIQIIGAITFMVALTIALIFLLNSVFLERYYLSHKKGVLTKVFEEIEDQNQREQLYLDTYLERFSYLCITNNITCLVVRPDGRVLLSSAGDNERLVNHMFRVLFSGGMGETVERYTIGSLSDDRSGGEFVSLLGSLPDGNTVFMESPLESIRDSVALSNRFLVVAGVIALLAGLALSLAIVAAILKPFSELRTEIALKEKNERMRREFISGISHDLKTPITLIMGYAQGLIEGICDTPEKQNHYLEVIFDEAEGMDGLITRLFLLNRLEYGREGLKLSSVNFSEIVISECESVKLLAENADVNIEVCIPGDIIGECDETVLRQVVLNYLTNAIKYATGEKKVVVSLRANPGEIYFSVFNTGEEISGDEKDKLWDMFYMGDKSRSTGAHSSGIGLSVVKAAATALSGECGLISHPDGSEFFFRFIY